MNADEGKMGRSQPDDSGLTFYFLIGGFGRRDWLVAGLLFFIAALSLYIGTARWPDTPDGLFHLQRVRALSEALRSGVLYPRWFPDFAFEYGHPILHYYAPAFYYPPALLHLAGPGAITATRMALALFFGLSGAAMYVLLRTWVSIPSAVSGAVVYLVFPYRLYDLFIRGALPEFAAFFWLPLVLFAIVQVGKKSLAKAQRSPKVSNKYPFAVSAPLREISMLIILASLAWAGLIITHNLTALMAGAAAVVTLLAVSVASGKFGRVGPTLLAGLLPLLFGLLLAAWYVMPALAESRWVGIGAQPVSHGYLNHFVRWPAMFDWSLLYTYPGAAEPTVPIPGWFLILTMIGLASLPYARRLSLGLPLAMGLALTLGSLWLTSAGSKWLWNLAAPILGKLQFPWRWQSITALGVALVAAILIELAICVLFHRLRSQGDNRHESIESGENRRVGSVTYDLLAWLLTGFVLILVVLNATAGINYSQASYSDADITKEQMWTFDAQYGQIGMTWTGEFLPRWVEEQRWAIGQTPSDGSSAADLAAAKMIVTPRQIGHFAATYDVNTAEATTLIWHRFFFPGWHVQIDGIATDTAATGNLGLLAVDVPPGQHIVTVAWQPTAAVWAGRGLAVLAWALALIALTVVQARKRWLATWLIMVVIAAGMILSPWTQETGPTAVNADFGSVRLEASSAATGRPGSIAPVRLHWLITAPSTPLTAYVHVLDASGAVVAQDDAPLAGDYTPSERWLPGLLIDHTHEIELPISMPTGIYTLKAGVYEPGFADTPLLPVGQDDPRVDIGVLEVHK